MEDAPPVDVTAERVMAYIAGTGCVTRFWHRKHEALHGFYRFAIARGYTQSCPLPEKLPRPSRIFTPYIYSFDELRRLIHATEQCVSSRTKLQAATLRTVLLPQLSTYLGHVHVSATQRYLTMTPDLLHQASVRFEQYARPTEIYHD